VTRLGEAIAPARLGAGFRLLLASSWVGNLGDGVSLAGGPLLLAWETHSPFLVALGAVLQRLPWLLFGLLAGVSVDRLNRRRLIIFAHLSRAGIAGTVAVLIVTGRVSVGVVLMALFILGCSEVLADTTATTILPMIVAHDDLGMANARLLGGVMVVNQLAGPAIGAGLFALTRSAPFVMEAATLATAAVLAGRLPRFGREDRGRRAVRHEIAEGLRWLWHNAPVRTLALTIVTFNVTFGAAWSVMVLYALARLHAGKIGFGLLTSAAAAGGIVGATIYGRLTAHVSLGNVMRIGLIIETLTHLSLALTRVTAVALVIMFVFGLHAQVWSVTATTVRQRLVPSQLQGRVGSVYLLGLQAGIVAGGAIGGVIAQQYGIVAPFWFAFIGSALLVILMWRQLPYISTARAGTAGPVPRPTAG
jgi:MFS family permease